MQTVSANFQNAFIADTMYLNHKVTVEFGSNRFNDGQVVTASSTKQVNVDINTNIMEPVRDFWKPEEVFNNKNRNTMKWLVCDRGATVKEEEDGTGYRAINLDDGEYERGWWSGNKSNASGDFAIPEYVQSEFYESNGTTPFQRRINKVVLYLTEGYRTMKEISIHYKSTGGVWTSIVSNQTVADGTYILEFPISEVICTGLRVRVHKTWDATDYARVNELQGYYIVDISDDVIDIGINEVRQEYDRTVPVGSTSSNDLSITLDNTTGKYNIKNTSSPLYPYIAANNKINVELGIDINQGVGSPSYEYVPMGEFWVDEWADDGGNTTASINARDFSKFLQDEIAQFSRVWTNTNVAACLTDIMSRAGKMPGSEINIDPAALRGFQILFIKDQSLWNFMTEVAFADQGIFGFDRNGDFYYHSYNRLNTAPYSSSVYDFIWDREIVEGNIRTELYANRAIVKVSPVNLENTGLRQIWQAPNSSILTWSKLGSAINTTATTITVQAAPNQSSANLTLNNWPQKGYLWLHAIDINGELTYGEVIKYNSRTDTSFTNCERGALGTKPRGHAAGAYIGEVEVFDVEYDNSPALKVNWPIVAMIDVIEKLDGEGSPQAHVIKFDSNPFTAKLAIGNIVNGFTTLQGSGISYANKYDGDTSDDVIYDWYTLVQGEVSVPDEGRQEIGRDNEKTAENLDYIRRYGKNEITIDNPWIQSKSHAEDIADIIIGEFKTPRELLNLETIMPLHIELGDRINILNYPQLNITGRQYHIVSIDWSYDGGLRASVTLREVKPA